MSKIVRVVNGDYKVGVRSGGTITFDTGVEAGSTILSGNVAVNGGTISTSKTQFNFLPTTADTVTFATAASSIEMGAGNGLTKINNSLQVSQNLAVNSGTITTTSVVVDMFPANAITINLGSIGSVLNLKSELSLSSDCTLGAGLNLNGGVLNSTSPTFNFLNQNVLTFNGLEAATSVTLGATSGTTNIRNNLDVSLDLAVNGGDITTTASAFNLANANALTVNAFAAATSLTFGAVTGLTSIRNGLSVNGDIEAAGGDLTTVATTASVFNTNATTVNAFGAGTNINIGAATGTTTIKNALAVTGDLTCDGGDILSSASTFNLLNSPTTISAFSNATTLSIGGTTNSASINIASGSTASGSTKTVNIGSNSASGSTTNINIGVGSGSTTVLIGTSNVTGSNSSQNLFNEATTVNAFNGATDLILGATTGTTSVRNDLKLTSIVPTSTTGNVFNTTATTVNIGGAATTIGIGASTGTTTVNNNLAVTGDAAINGGDLTTSGTSFNLLNTTATTINAFGAATTISMGASGGTLTIAGNLVVNGTTTTINSTVMSVDDINITLGDTASPTDAAASGGGITLKGTTDKTINWITGTSSWTSSENFDLVTGKTYKINGTNVLSATGLGSGVVSSSLTSVGTIGTGVWNGTIITPTYGGTGVNNGSSTITIGGNLSFSGAFTTAFTVTGATALTLPTSGTVAVLGNNLGQFGSTTSLQLANIISDETGSGSLVFATSPTLTTPTIATVNGSTSASGTLTLQSTTNATKATAGILMTENIASSSYTTGTLVVTGGVGVGGDINTNGNGAFNGTGALKVPAGADGTRPTGAAGHFRFNTTSTAFEGYNGISWITMSNILGPTSGIVDGALVRFSGTTGKLLKASNVVITDSDELYGYKASVNYQTELTYTLQSSDTGKIIDHANASGITVTLPNDLSTGFACTYMQTGIGQITFVAGNNAAIRNRLLQYKTAGQWAAVTVYVHSNTTGTNAEYVLAGDTGA